jgi:hypothetical protein
MKRLLCLLILMTSTSAFAQSDERSAKAATHNVSALLGHNAGGFNFGVSYEHMMDNSVGFGGHVRLFNKEDSGTNQVNGYMIIGGAMGYHFYKKNWDLSFSPSVNMINIDSVSANPDDASVIGPGLTISLVSQLTPNFAIGFDNSRYWVWFDDDYAGLAIDDFAVKARMSF